MRSVKELISSVNRGNPSHFYILFPNSNSRPDVKCKSSASSHVMKCYLFSPIQTRKGDADLRGILTASHFIITILTFSFHVNQTNGNVSTRKGIMAYMYL